MNAVLAAALAEGRVSTHLRLLRDRQNGYPLAVTAPKHGVHGARRGGRRKCEGAGQTINNHGKYEGAGTDISNLATPETESCD